MKLSLRCSSVAAILTGRDGLTDKQTDRIYELSVKEKRTAKQEEELEMLIAKRDAPIELPKGAISHIEEMVDRQYFEYKDSFSSRETEKGNMVEDDSIELYNRVFFKSYQKSDRHLESDFLSGHPDIVDENNKMVIDIKSSWSKKTFPKLPRHADNDTYVWQVKAYLYLLGWTKGQIAYCLISTPESLLNEWDDDTLHYVDHIPDEKRITIINVELTENDREFIKKRLSAAKEYAEKYLNELINK